MSFEYKFKLPSKILFNDILAFCEKHCAVDIYCHGGGFYHVVSAYKYFNKCSGSSIKIRLREYSHEKGKDYFVEEKKRTFDGIQKRRLQITFEQYLFLLYCANRVEFFMYLKQIGFELSVPDYNTGVFDTYILEYDRIPWTFYLNQKKYRITLDYNISAFINKKKYDLLEDKAILELKGEQNASELIRFFMEQFPIQISKISKVKMAQRELKKIKCTVLDI